MLKKYYVIQSTVTKIQIRRLLSIIKKNKNYENFKQQPVNRQN